MKNKKLLSVILAGAFVFSSFTTVFAAGSIVLKMGSASEKIEAGKIIELPVSAEQNTGYVNGSVDISWDTSALELAGVKYNDIAAPDAGSPDVDDYINSTGKYRVTFGDDTNWYESVNATGTFFTLQFKVKDTASAGTYAVSMKGVDGSFIDVDLNDVNYDCTGGSITLTGGSGGNSGGGNNTPEPVKPEPVKPDNPEPDKPEPGQPSNDVDAILRIKIDNIRYEINGTQAVMDSAPFIDENSRTMLPVRVVANALGVPDEDIAWNDGTKTAIFKRSDGKLVSCTVGSNVINVGGENTTIDTVPVIRNDRIYLPLRALFNAFNVSDDHIIWDGTARTVTVTK